MSSDEDFELEGLWWRSDGEARVEATRPPLEPPGRVGLEEGLRYVTQDSDPLLGRSEASACPGRLNVGPNRGPRLWLPGATDRVFDEAAGNFTVFGTGEDGVDYSLLDCFPGQGILGGPSTAVEIVGHHIVRGAHVASLEQFAFSRVELSLVGVREFVWGPVRNEEGVLVSGLVGGVDDELAIELPDARVTIVCGAIPAPSSPDGRERAAWLRLEAREAITDAEWQDRWVEPLLSFLRLATALPCRVERFVVVRSVLHGDTGEWPVGEDRADIAIVEARSDLLREPDSPRYRRQLLGTGAFVGGIGAVLARWFVLSRQLGRAGGLLFAVMQARGFLDAQLVTLASVGEGYHRARFPDPPFEPADHDRAVDAMLDAVEAGSQREHYRVRLTHANDFSQRQRLRRVLDRASQVLPEFSVGAQRLANRIVNTRNYLVHLPLDETPPLEGLEMAEASRLLVMALEANLLLDLDIGLSHAQGLIAEAYGQQRIYWRLRERGAAWPEQ